MGAMTINLFQYIFDMVLLPPLTKSAGQSPLSINLEVALSLEISSKTPYRLFFSQFHSTCLTAISMQSMVSEKYQSKWYCFPTL